MKRIISVFILVYGVGFACNEGRCVTELKCRLLESWRKSSLVYSARVIDRIIDSNIKFCLNGKKFDTFYDTLYYIFPTSDTTCMGKYWSDPRNDYTDIPIIIQKVQDYIGNKDWVDTLYPQIFAMCPKPIPMSFDGDLVFEDGGGRIEVYSKSAIVNFLYVMENTEQIADSCKVIEETQKTRKPLGGLDELDLE